MKIDSSMTLLSGRHKGITQLADRYFTNVGLIQKEVKMVAEVPVLFYSNHPGGGEISAEFIGAFTYFNYNPEIRNVEEIGRFCSFAQNVVIGVGGHSTTALSHHQIFERKQLWAEPFWQYDANWVNENKRKNFEIESKRSKKTTIGNDVWIGCNSIVMAGVTIGDGAIIAAGAVVTKDVLPYTIVAGVPAKKIKERFPEELKERIKKTKWWEYGPDVLKDLDISNPDQCIDELEGRIRSGVTRYIPDKFEFNRKDNTITKIYKDGKKELIYKL